MPYFDHNATTPLDPEVGATYAEALRAVPGNASSIHRTGQAARQRLEIARATLARLIGAAPKDVVFTSGGTESNNLAILGSLADRRVGRAHVVTTTIEHPSVLAPFRRLEGENVDVTYVRLPRSGVLDPLELRRCLRDDTAFVSVMHANNETGSIQPVSQIAQIVRERRAAGQPIYLHCDGVQALGKIRVNMDELGVDLYSASAHKLHGPKGIGLLFVRPGTPLSNLTFGGRQERGRRPGTENVGGAIAFARALELSTGFSSELRDRFEQGVLSALDGVEVNGSSESRLQNTSNLLFRNVSGEALLIALDQADMAVSTGSACSSGSIEPSHVLLAIGLSVAEARSSVRFSFGRFNTAAEIDSLIAQVIAAVRRLRAVVSRRQLVS